MANKTRKKRTRPQEKKRNWLLESLLNQWVYCRMGDEFEHTYMFFKHKASEDQSNSKIEQIILSDDLTHDGVYLIMDYDLEKVYDVKKKQDVIRMIIRKYDLKIGKHAATEDTITQEKEDLMKELVKGGYLEPEEFMVYCQNGYIPQVDGMKEIILAVNDEE